MAEVVVASEGILQKARSRFPPGGSVDGTPSLRFFEEGPLQSAIEYFSRRFDEAAVVAPGLDNFRYWITRAHTFFGPIVFYAIRTVDGIEIIDFDDDPEYWQVIAEDRMDDA